MHLTYTMYNHPPWTVVKECNKLNALNRQTTTRRAFHLSTQARKLRDVRIAQHIVRVEAVLGKAPDSDSQRGDLLLERCLPAKVTVAICPTTRIIMPIK